MRDIPTASQIIAALVKRVERSEGGHVKLSYADLMEFGTRWPTTLHWNEDLDELTLTIEPDNLATNPRWNLE